MVLFLLSYSECFIMSEYFVIELQIMNKRVKQLNKTRLVF